MQRFVVSEYKKEISMEIPIDKFNKKVDINYLILADQDIPYYKNSDTHSDYHGVTFKINKGDILAFSQSQTIFIEKQPITKTNSIFKVSKSPLEKSEPFKIFLNSNQIDIELPPGTFEKVGYLQNFGDDTNKLLQSIVYLPSLIDTLFRIQELSQIEYGLDDYVNLDWYRTLEKKLNSKKMEISNLDTDKIISISYDMLFSESGHPLTSLENLVFNLEGEEDDNDI